MEENLQSILGIPTPVGAEFLMAQYLRELLETGDRHITTDNVGNVFIGDVSSERGNYCFSVHGDQVSFIVEEQKKSGDVIAIPQGSIQSITIGLGQQVAIYDYHMELVVKGNIAELISDAKLPLEILAKIAKKKEESIEDGKVDKEKAEKNKNKPPQVLSSRMSSVRIELDEITEILPGYHVIFDVEPVIENGFLKGVGLDNKIGIYIMTELIKTINSETVSALVTAGEEIGCIGAEVAQKSISNLNTIIVIDTSPQILGTGPTLYTGAYLDTKLFIKMKQIAEENDIPFSIKVAAEKVKTDGRVLYKSGAKMIQVTVPIKNIHTDHEEVSLLDIEKTIKLLQKFYCPT